MGKSGKKLEETERHRKKQEEIWKKQKEKGRNKKTQEETVMIWREKNGKNRGKW